MFFDAQGEVMVEWNAKKYNCVSLRSSFEGS